MRNKHSILVAAQEIRAVLKRDTTARYIYEQTKRDVERLNKEIKDVESKMKDIIQASEELKVNYLLATSIKGIALINTVALMIHTDNFTRFQNCRQLACYAGVVPFEKTSGSSIKGGSHVSHLANIQIKTLLTQAARSAVLYNPELRQYYERKIKEGKLEQVVINNVRNKLLHRIFAIVQKKQPYQANYNNQLNKNAA
jgi:transposase